jgi:spoIIIJ-associated protein
VAHAEASARTVEAAVTAAAAELGLRSDQVDVEVLEEPVPSTFGFIGSPARVRVTSRRQPDAPSGEAPEGSPVNGPGVAVRGRPSETPEAVDAGRAPDTIELAARGPSEAIGGSAQGQPSDASRATLPADSPDPAQAVPLQAPEPGASGPAPIADPAPAPDPGRAADPTGAAAQPGAPGEDGAGSVSHQLNPPNQTQEPKLSDGSETPINSTPTPEGEPRHPASDLAYDSAPTGSDSAEPRDASRPATTRASLPSAPPVSAVGEDGSPGVSTAATASAMETTPQESAASERSNATRSRRTHRDEPVDPEMVEADTERAGDFLEGLLDALDVDGDITTWIDEAGGHIELEGSDLNVLVGANGETLDALQELTRIAVLRQSKRRVRLLLDINGFRSRQRDELISVVKATAEQVIRSREDHEFQPMTPAERKIVHDAVAAIDGVQTESLGEEPYRRVVIRPA